jgi:hypothetical protein
MQWQCSCQRQHHHAARIFAAWKYLAGTRIDRMQLRRVHRFRDNELIRENKCKNMVNKYEFMMLKILQFKKQTSFCAKCKTQTKL